MSTSPSFTGSRRLSKTGTPRREPVVDLEAQLEPEEPSKSSKPWKIAFVIALLCAVGLAIGLAVVSVQSSAPHGKQTVGSLIDDMTKAGSSVQPAGPPHWRCREDCDSFTNDVTAGCLACLNCDDPEEKEWHSAQCCVKNKKCDSFNNDWSDKCVECLDSSFLGAAETTATTSTSPNTENFCTQWGNDLNWNGTFSTHQWGDNGLVNTVQTTTITVENAQKIDMVVIGPTANSTFVGTCQFAHASSPMGPYQHRMTCTAQLNDGRALTAHYTPMNCNNLTNAVQEVHWDHHVGSDDAAVTTGRLERML